MKLQELLIATEDLADKDRSEAFKKSFEVYTDNIDVTGNEIECFSILINLTSKPVVAVDNPKLARAVVTEEFFWTRFRKVASQLHTHNLKWPDARVSLKHHIRVVQKAGSLPKLGWSGNSSDYRFGRLLTSTFIWREKEHSLISIWLGDFVEWRKVAYKLGLNKAFWYLIKQELETLFRESHFPDVVDSYSPVLLYPYQNHYLTVTPVVSHESQLAVQLAKGLPIHSLSFPHPSALGVLCGSLGGHVRMLRLRPLNSQNAASDSVIADRGYFPSNCITNKSANSIYRKIVDVKNYSSLRVKRKARLIALAALDSVLEQWLATFLQLKLNKTNIDKDLSDLDEEERTFLLANTPDIYGFSRHLNRKLHSELEGNKHSRYFSYHQRLVGVTQKRLVSIITRQLANTSSYGNSKETYIILQNLRVNEANGFNNPYVVGMPSMIGLFGFVHLFERQFRDVFPSFSCESFALHCCHYSHHAATSLPAPSIPDKDFIIKRAGVMPKFIFDGKFSIVIKVSCDSNDETMLDIEEVKQSLPDRLWGGSVHPPSLFEATEWVYLAHGASELSQHLIQHQYMGNWICPHKNQASDIESRIEMLKNNPELSLCLVGYDLLEEIKPRNVASGIHAFSQPLVDLCCLKSTPRVTRTTKFLEQAFWKYVPVSQSCTTLRVSPVCGESHAASQSTEL